MQRKHPFKSDDYLDEFDMIEKSIDTDPDPSPKPGAAKLRRYWTKGPGAAKIKWGVPGDFMRCVGHLSKYVGPENAKGLCNVYHRAATGVAPGQEGKKSLDFVFDRKALEITSNMMDGLLNPTETKGTTEMTIEYKSVGVSGVVSVDEQKGIVEAIVSVTGIVDGVNDVIMPGAYEKTLAQRTPKGVWSHSWDHPVSRTLQVKELMPGDPRLPKTLPNGEAWPEVAGALAVKMEFNLKTQRGRDAYADVVFFGDQQEWSIGYQVPPDGKKIDSKTGQRWISYLNLYEYSPVLFGAMSPARTLSVKSAQVAQKAIEMEMEDFIEWKKEMFDGLEIKDAVLSEPAGDENADASNFEGDEPPSSENVESDGDGEVEEVAESELEDESFEDSDFGDEDVDASPEDDEGEPVDSSDREEASNEEKSAAAASTTETAATGVSGGDAEAGSLFDDETTPEDADPEDETEEDRNTLMVIVSDVIDDLGDYADRIEELADEFDLGVSNKDTELAADSADELLDIIDDNREDVEDKVLAAFRKIAGAISELLPDEDSDFGDDTATDGADPEDGADVEAPVEEKDGDVADENQDAERTASRIATGEHIGEKQISLEDFKKEFGDFV